MWVCSCCHSGSENISVPSSAMPTLNEAAAWALGEWDRLFEPADSAAGTPTTAPSASEQTQSSSAAAKARRGREVVIRRVVNTAIETAYTPQSCVSLRPRGEPRGRIGWQAMRNGRWRYWGPLSVVLVVAFALRLWGIKQGLPYVYDVDEYGHFVPEAVAMFDHGLNPHYFVNPPALTYLLHVVFGVWFGLIGLGSRSSVTREFALHPDRLFLLARIAVALLGTISVWLLYLVGARLFDRAVGLLASAVMAVAFLPVFYGHLALNDAPTLAPLTLSLLGTAGVLRKGRARDYLLAGVGLGFACAGKYTAGIAIVPLIAAVAARFLEGRSAAGRHALGGTALAAVAALGAFALANPYALLD